MPSDSKIFDTSQPGPGAALEKFNEIQSAICIFFVKHIFFSCDLPRFCSPGPEGQVGRVIVVKRTFFELVWSSMQNLVDIGSLVCLRKRDTVCFIFR